MNSNIMAILNKCENLTLKVNVGEKHRISKPGLKGSLWLEPQKEAFRLKLTGDVETYLSNYVINNFGAKSYDDQGYPVWHLTSNGSMGKVVSEFNKI